MAGEEGARPSPKDLGVRQDVSASITSSWEQVLGGRIGEEFKNAARGRIKNNRYHNGYTMREFVRAHPQEATQLVNSYRIQSGETHPQLFRAIHEVDELNRNPIAVPPEDPRYIGLAYNIEADPDYQAIVTQLNREHTQSLFGADDSEAIKHIPLQQFMRLASSDQNLLRPQQREIKAQQLFEQNFTDRAQLYRQRELTRVYRDPDGVINPQLDPVFPNDLTAIDEKIKLQQFAQRYPDKAKAYATVEPRLKPFVENPQQVSSQRQLETMSRLADAVAAGSSKPEALQNYVFYLRNQGVPKAQIKAILDAKGIPNSELSDGEKIENIPPVTSQIQVIDSGPPIVGGEIITPTARLAGEINDQNAQERGWLSAITSAFGKTDLPVDERQVNVQEIVDAARAAGIPREKIKQHLAGLGIQAVTKEDTATSQASLTEDEIRQLSNQAGNFVRSHPPTIVQFGSGFEVESPYVPIALMEQRLEINPEIGRRFDAHGIAKGGRAEQLRTLNFLLSKGIDPSRPFHSAALRMSHEDENAIAAAIGAAGPYDNGAFIVIGRPDQSLRDGIAGVLVNEHFYDAIPILQTRFSNVKFIKASEIPNGLNDLLKGQDNPPGNAH